MEKPSRNRPLNLCALGVYPHPMDEPKEGIVLDREGNEICAPESVRRQSNSTPHIRVIRGGPLLGVFLILALPVLLFFGFGIVIVILALMTTLGILSRLFGTQSRR